MNRDDEAPRRVCVCQHCGGTFIYGQEDDNEKYHLRCERELTWPDDLDDGGRFDYDIED